MRSPVEMIRNSSLKEEALTHRSFTQELKLTMPDFERLEFLGDALLDCLVAELLMRHYPQDTEGVLSKKRASLVNEEVLATKAINLGLDQQIKLGPAEAKSGGAQKASLLSDVFESVLAALYLDQGFETARMWLEEVFENDLRNSTSTEFEKDYKTRFQEWAQSEKKKTPKYVLLKESGPDHQKHFHVEVRIDDEFWGEGYGMSKKKAEQQAAESALRRIL